MNTPYRQSVSISPKKPIRYAYNKKSICIRHYSREAYIQYTINMQLWVIEVTA